MSELSRLAGVGPKRLKALEEAGIRTLRDLVYHAPRRYIDRTRVTPVSTLREGDDAFFVARVESVKTPPGRLIVTVADETGSLELAFFNAATFLRQQLLPGRRLSVAGVVKRFRTLQIAHPEWELLREDDTPRGGLLPVYPLTGGLAETRAEHKLLQKFALEALDRFDFSDPLSQAERAFLDLPPEKETLRTLHAPESLEALEAARAALKTRELWPLCVRRAAARRERLRRGRTFPATPQARAAEDALRAALPFVPTVGQEEVLARLGAALGEGGQFLGLLHGDVGSGKTAVALLSAVRVLSAGAQVALLAPTEILAAQHARTLGPWLRAAGFESALLTGDTPLDERRRVAAALADGSLSFVTGTHALLSSGIVFRDLRYALVDEQHRFGVAQRAQLVAKGIEPHVLYLSATPIPRTLAQTLAGDMEVLMLREKPAGRLPVKTRVVPAAKQAELMDFLVAETRERGNQVYWVVPRIDGSPATAEKTGGGEQASDAFEGHETAAVEGALRRLRAAGDWTVAALHGRIPAPDRTRVLEAFRSGTINALVATTVIEVGVDVPGANLMVVDGADRFGLAQLHQLRGRTGRGSAQAWCFLLEPAPLGWAEDSEARLRGFASTEDGFALAEADLRHRGAGSLEGVVQSGFGQLRFADILDDADRIRELGERAGEWLDSHGD